MWSRADSELSRFNALGLVEPSAGSWSRGLTRGVLGGLVESPYQCWAKMASMNESAVVSDSRASTVHTVVCVLWLTNL